MLRPSECPEKRVEPNLHDLSPQKLSRPQKRRKRLQTLAVHRASETTSGKTAENKQECVHAKLQHPEYLMISVCCALGILVAHGQVGAHTEQPPEYGTVKHWCGMPTTFGGLLQDFSQMMPDAPVFQPRSATETADDKNDEKDVVKKRIVPA